MLRAIDPAIIGLLACHRTRRRHNDNAPVKFRQLQSTVLVGIAILIAAVFISLVRTADHPLLAAGIVLQTLAGLFAAMQLWANNASNALLRWAAEQINSNRWHIAGLFDGRLRSLLIATTWLALAYFANRLLQIWNPDAIVGWPVAIFLAANFVLGGLAFFLALLMCAGAHLLDGEPLPDGEASTALEARLAANDWIWPFIALAFLTGGILQVAAA